MQPAIRAEGLRIVRGGKRHGVVIIDGMNLEVPSGQVVGLLGPSGSGKTTLMRAIVGAQEGVTGVLDVLGLPAGHPDLRHRVGYVTQSPSIYADLSIMENLRYFARLIGADQSDAERALADVDLARIAGRKVGVLSGGERSRVSLAVALLGKPDLLVLDEPTVGLDPVLRRDLWKMFRGLAEGGATLVVSSHVLDEATGREIAARRVGPTSRFASPVLSGRLVLVPTLAGVTALRIS